MSDKKGDLAARIARLEDLEDIRYTMRDYCRRLDTRDWDGLGDVFTEDAVLEMQGMNHLAPVDGQYRGRTAIIKDGYGHAVATLRPADQQIFITGHICTNMQIELEGDEATALAYFFELISNDRVLMGTYQYRFRREADRWRASFLRISTRYRARLEATEVGGQTLIDILARPF